MKYIAVDFEWNQSAYAAGTKTLEDGKRFGGEIIQIGAVKLAPDKTIESVFKTEIRPVVYRRMNKKVAELTGIGADMLKNAPLFEEVLPRFVEWCEDEPVFLTWGLDDLRVLRQNCQLHGLASDFCKTWYNLQVIYNRQTGSDSTQKSLATAIEHFGIGDTLKAHDALNDAYYTAMIAGKLDLEKGIAEYAVRKSPLCGRDTDDKTVFHGVKSRKAMLADKAICEPLCPTCGKKFCELQPYVRANRYQYMSLARCGTCGDFVIRLRVHDCPDKTKTVSRTVRESTPEAVGKYDALVARSLEKQKKNEMPDENGTGIK